MLCGGWSLSLSDELCLRHWDWCLKRECARMVKRNSVRPDMQRKKKEDLMEVQRQCNDWGTSEERAACFEAAWAQHRERYGLGDSNCKASPALQLPVVKPSPTPSSRPAPAVVKKGILKLAHGQGAQRKLVHFAKRVDYSSSDDDGLMG